MRRLSHKRLLLFSVAVVVLSIGVGGAWSITWGEQAEIERHSVRTLRTVAPPTPTDITTLRQVASQLAASNNERNPANMRVVATTRTAANILDSGASVSSDENVFMVTMTGDFKGLSASVPAGHQAPFGTVLTFTFDPQTRTILDYSIGQSVPNLAQLGTVVDLTP